MWTLKRLFVSVMIIVGATVAIFADERTRIWPGDKWSVSTPVVEGVDPAIIDSILSDIRAGEFGAVDHFLMIRNGKIIADQSFDVDYKTLVDAADSHNHPISTPCEWKDSCENQFNYDKTEWHPWYKGTRMHTLQSVTKSVISAVVGTAVDRGLIKSVDVKVVPFFNDYNVDLSDARWQAMTLEDLLTMRSGIAWDIGNGYQTAGNSTELMEGSKNWIEFILSRPMEADPGTVYNYSDGVAVLQGKVLRQATGQRADDWARKYLFEPIGIKNFYWKITPDGEADTEGGLYLSPHDLARIGYLYLNEGEWNGHQVLSKNWVARSTSPIVDLQDKEGEGVFKGYGWIVIPPIDGKGGYFEGSGFGGQILSVSREHDIVLVVNGWNLHKKGIKQSWQIFPEYILPALNN